MKIDFSIFILLKNKVGNYADGSGQIFKFYEK